MDIVYYTSRPPRAWDARVEEVGHGREQQHLRRNLYVRACHSPFRSRDGIAFCSFICPGTAATGVCVGHYEDQRRCRAKTSLTQSGDARQEAVRPSAVALQWSTEAKLLKLTCLVMHAQLQRNLLHGRHLSGGIAVQRPRVPESVTMAARRQARTRTPTTPTLRFGCYD
ncbi:hypothetical protein GQ600_2584 [Phytophthora cactorum]|nr:hypothetical protein GQ600_2584 [Phytophthora cactorum]